MVVAKVPTWSVTGSVRGLIAGAVLLKVKLDSRSKASCVWSGAEADVERVALKARKGSARRRRHDGHANGVVPTGTVATTVLVAVAITETLLELHIRDIDAFSVRRHGDAKCFNPTPIVATTVFLVLAITETLVEPVFVT